jgi:hypothetical protein
VVSVLDKQRLPLRIVWVEIREGSPPAIPHRS